MVMQSQVIECEDSIDQIYEEFYRRGRTDGLPIIPPTKERVTAMMSSVDRTPTDSVGELAPSRARATIEKLAINAVMAGCLPSYFPIIVAATEALADPEFNLFSIATTTNPATPMLIINGPIRNKIDLNCGWDVLGPGRRANATIGRAITLILLNIAGRTPGEGTKCVLGHPGRYGMCIGEREEESPWEPLHVERGFKHEDSVVTVMSPSGIHACEDVTSRSARELLINLSGGLHFSSSLNCWSFWGAGEMAVVMCPLHAQIMARDGMSKQEVQQYFFEHTQDVPISWFSEELPEEMRSAMTGELTSRINIAELVRKGLVKPGQTQITEKGVSMAARPDQFAIVVAGGDAGHHMAYLPCFGDSMAVSRRII